MRKLFLLTLPMLLLLTGCARQDGERFESWRERVLSTELCFDAAVCAVTERGEVNYAAACRIGADGTEMTLTAPELCAGISVHCDADGSELRYDGAVLALPRCRLTGDDPIAAIPGLADAIRWGRVTALHREGEQLTVLLAVDERKSAELTLDGNDRLVSASLRTEGAELAAITAENGTMR